MAKIIAEAKDNPELWKMQLTCTGAGWDGSEQHPCYRLIEIDGRDIYKRGYTDISGSTDIYYGFICPACGTFTEISEDKIPESVKGHARDYGSRPKTGLDFNKMQ